MSKRKLNHVVEISKNLINRDDGSKLVENTSNHKKETNFLSTDQNYKKIQKEREIKSKHKYNGKTSHRKALILTNKNKAYNSKSNNNNFNSIDKINLKIIGELLNNADVKSSDIAQKIKILLSTVQRRRAFIERTLLKKNYNFDTGSFGFREAELYVNIPNGQANTIGEKLLNKYDNLSFRFQQE